MQISFEMVSNAHVRQLCPLNIHWRQDSLVYPACWILISQFKFQARQPYARLPSSNPQIAPCLDIVLDAADLNGEHLKLCVKGHSI